MVIVVTNRVICKGDFFERLEEIVCVKPDAVILREKSLSTTEYQLLAEKCKKICDKYGVDLIVNTFISSAKKAGIKKVQLPMAEFLRKRSELNDFEEIGVSVHSLDEAILAEKLGATFLIAGHIYMTPSKPDMPSRGVEFIENICERVSVPVMAIGGITPTRVPKVEKAGAKGVCIMTPLMTCENPRRLTIEYKMSCE